MTLNANQIYLLGKMYMSFGDGQWDQGNHIALDDANFEVFRPLHETLSKIFDTFKESGEDIKLGDILMGAVESFFIDHGMGEQIEMHWLDDYLDWRVKHDPSSDRWDNAKMGKDIITRWLVEQLKIDGGDPTQVAEIMHEWFQPYGLIVTSKE